MAACALLVETADTGATPNTSGTFTPTIGALQIVFVGASDTVDNTLTFTHSSGLTFTLASVIERSGSAGRSFCYVADALTSNGDAGQSVTVDMPTDVASGTTIFVMEVSGMTKFGLDAIRQVAEQENQTVASNPEPDFTFGLSCLTGNPTILHIANANNTTGLAAPTGWTQPTTGDIGHATPNHGAHICFRDSGFTGTGIDYAPSASGAAWGGIAVELDASGAAGGARRRRLGMMGVG